MPSSVVRTFSDPDDYAETIGATRAEMTVVGRGQFTAELTRIDLHRLRMIQFSDNLPRVLHTAAVTGLAIILFRTQPGSSLPWGGLEVEPTSIVRFSEGEDAFQHSSGAASFGTMSLPVEDMASIGETLTGCDLTPPSNAMLVAPPAAALARLQRLHAAARQLAEDAPEIIANPDAARGLEQTLIKAMADCLAYRQEHENRWAQGQHAIVMRRFRRMVEEHSEQPLFIPEICTAIRVSDRMLRVCCQEHLGMSPKRYLLLRRMNLARRALREPTRDGITVTDVAMRYGFWQLGRFAVEYRSLFGELPSNTLGHPRK